MVHGFRKIFYNFLWIALIYGLSFFYGQGIVQKTENVVQPVDEQIKFGEVIKEAAKQNSVHPALIKAVIHAESGFNPRARSNVGARGLMQIMPSTQKYLKLKNAFDPQQNVEAGSRYLKELINRFNGKLSLAIAAYNAGPGAVARFGGVPPYKQTRQYVQKVLAYYRQYLKSEKVTLKA